MKFLLFSPCVCLLPVTQRCEYAYPIAEASVDVVRILEQIQSCHKPFFVQADGSEQVAAIHGLKRSKACGTSDGQGILGSRPETRSRPGSEKYRDPLSLPDLANQSQHVNKAQRVNIFVFTSGNIAVIDWLLDYMVAILIVSYGKHRNDLQEIISERFWLSFCTRWQKREISDRGIRPVAWSTWLKILFLIWNNQFYMSIVWSLWIICMHRLKTLLLDATKFNATKFWSN